MNLNWIRPIGILKYARAPFQIFSNDLTTVFKWTFHKYSLILYADDSIKHFHSCSVNELNEFEVLLNMDIIIRRNC